MADSRNEAILEATINDTEYDAAPQSRIEELLLELKAVIESGGGGGEITIDQSLSPSSPNAVRNSAIYSALEGKANTSYVDEKILEEIGDITTFEYYLCEPGEYDAQGVPTVANPDTNHIYLTPTSGTNLNMYAYINSTFTFLGTTEVNLDGYATVAAMNAALAQKADKSEFDDCITSTELTTALSTKADKSELNDFVKESELATVAKTGSYNNLSDKPTIPTVPGNIVKGKKNGTNTELTINVLDSGGARAGNA